MTDAENTIPDLEDGTPLPAFEDFVAAQIKPVTDGEIINVPRSSAKAIWAAVLAGLGGALTSAQAFLVADADWTNPGTYINIVAAGLAGAGILGPTVWHVTNKPKLK